MTKVAVLLGAAALLAVAAVLFLRGARYAALCHHGRNQIRSVD